MAGQTRRYERARNQVCPMATARDQGVQLRHAMRNSGLVRLSPIREDAHHQHSPFGLGRPEARQGSAFLVAVNGLRFVIAGLRPLFDLGSCIIRRPCLK